MSQILTILYVVFGVLLLFGAAVFVHEWGHYWMARKRGLKVEAFAIGFGPKIFGWTKDGIEYSWRWIPAGGFVKLPQMVTSEAIEGKNDDQALPPISPLSKILVAFAGPFMNVVFAFAIASVLYFTGLPVLVNPSVIGYVDPKSAEYALGIREGDKIVRVGGKRTKSWQDVQMAAALSRTNFIPVVIESAGVQKSYTLEAKNNEQIGLKILNLDPRDHPVLMDVVSGSAAEEAKLKVKDVVISFSGVPIASKEQLIDLIHKRAGQPSEIWVQRGSEKLALTVTPKMDPTTKVGRIGVALGSNSKNVYEVQRPGPKPWDNIMDVFTKTIETFSALFHSKETGVGAKDLSGPVGILSLLGSQLVTDYRLALNFLVLLNINLAVLNLMPMPVLDGGHILMAILEKIRRKPLSPKIVEYVTTGFAVLLISLMLYVSFHDIKRISLFKAMFQQESQIESAPNKPEETETPAPAPAR